jgi:hypothetical protein
VATPSHESPMAASQGMQVPVHCSDHCEKSLQAPQPLQERGKARRRPLQKQVRNPAPAFLLLSHSRLVLGLRAGNRPSFFANSTSPPGLTVLEDLKQGGVPDP